MRQYRPGLVKQTANDDLEQTAHWLAYRCPLSQNNAPVEPAGGHRYVNNALTYGASLPRYYVLCSCIGRVARFKGRAFF